MSDFDHLMQCQFKTRNELLDAVHSLGGQQGYKFTVKRSERDRRVILQCVHGGQRRKDTHRRREGAKMRSRVSRRKGCQWELKARYEIKDSTWKIWNVVDQHNHQPSSHYHHATKVSESEVSPSRYTLYAVEDVFNEAGRQAFRKLDTSTQEVLQEILDRLTSPGKEERSAFSNWMKKSLEEFLTHSDDRIPPRLPLVSQIQ